MRKNVFSKMGALALILSAGLVLTSCDELFGDWDNPISEGGSSGSEGSGSGSGGASATKTAGSISYASATFKRGTADPAFIIDLTNTGDGAVTYESSDPSVATVDPSTGKVTPVATGETTITATVSDSEGYTYATKTASYELTLVSGLTYIINGITQEPLNSYEYTEVISSDADVNMNTSKPYLVKGTVTINGDVSVCDDPHYVTKIILCDGAELVVTGIISGKYLDIYAQSNGANMGKLTVTNSAGHAIDLQEGSLYFYGGKITATSTKAGGHGIYANAIYVDGGEVKAQGGAGGHGVQYRGGCIYLNNGKLEAIGGDNAGGTGGNGIHSTGGASVYIQNNNAVLIAQGGSGATGGDGVDVSYDSYSSLDYKLGQFTAIGGTGTTTNGQGINGKLVNESGAMVTFQTSTDGTNWPEEAYFGLAASATSTPTAFGVRKVD